MFLPVQSGQSIKPINPKYWLMLELTLPLDEVLCLPLHNLFVQNLLNFICFTLTAATVRHVRLVFVCGSETENKLNWSSLLPTQHSEDNELNYVNFLKCLGIVRPPGPHWQPNADPCLWLADTSFPVGPHTLAALVPIGQSIHKLNKGRRRHWGKADLELYILSGLMLTGARLSMSTSTENLEVVSGYETVRDVLLQRYIL